MGVKLVPRGQLCPWGCWRAECMAAAGGLVQGPASSGAGLVVVMVTWSICSPWISLRRARRRSKDDWVPLCRASRLVLSSRHFCREETGAGGGVSQKPTVQASWGCHPLSPLSQCPSPLLGRGLRGTSPRALTKTRQPQKTELLPDTQKFVSEIRPRNRGLGQERGTFFLVEIRPTGTPRWLRG